MTRLLALLVAASVLAPAQAALGAGRKSKPAAEAEKPKIRAGSLAVMDTVAQNTSDALAALVTQTISSYTANTLGLEVISKDDIKRLVSFQTLQQLAGCEGETCARATDLAKSLGAERVLTATLGRIGEHFQLSVVVMDTSTGAVSGRATREIRTEDEIVENARDLAHFALTHQQRESKGYLRITVSAVAAQISVDGASVGVSPLPTPVRILAGHHAVHVEKTGFLPFDGAIDVEAGKEAGLEVTLIAKKSIQVAGAGYLPWAGATAGIALVVGGVAIYGYVTADAKYKQYNLGCKTLSCQPSLTASQLSTEKAYVQLWGNEVAFYGGIAAGVVGAASVALFTAYFITGLGAGGDAPAMTAPVTIAPTPDGFVLRF